jgi:long-chain acyl-CoA synthetase
MIQHPEVRAKFKKEINKFNESFAQWEQVKKFELLPQIWSIESGELTAKLSVKRKVIYNNYRTVIESLYK